MASPIVTQDRLREALSLAVADRSPGYIDLVSDSTALLNVMRDRGMFQPFSGPEIRETLLYAHNNNYTRYSGFQELRNAPAEIMNDAVFTPKLAAIGVSLSGEEILRNSGANQIIDVMTAKLEAAEMELQDEFYADLHSNGAADGGKQIGGLQLAIPTNVSSGTYGGISRANTIWQTNAYDAHTDFSAEGYTQVDKSSVRRIYERIMIETSRNRRGPDLILASQQHYQAFSDSMSDIQRIQGNLGQLGFTSLVFAGPGRALEVVLEGGIRSAMPNDVTYFIDTQNLKFRFHPDRNFTPLGEPQMPINQDGVVQYIGFYGELTMCNPLHMTKLYDSNTAS